MVSAGRRRLLIQGCLAALAASMVVLAAAATASAPVIENGGFETGSLKGWKTSNSPDSGGTWSVYSGNSIGLPPPPPKRGMTATPVHKPPRGKHAAITTENGPCTTILYQDFTVPKHATLTLFAYYKSQASMTTRSDLDAEDDLKPNQQYRIDLMKPSADLRSARLGGHRQEDLPHEDRRPAEGRPDEVRGWAREARRPEGSPARGADGQPRAAVRLG